MDRFTSLLPASRRLTAVLGEMHNVFVVNPNGFQIDASMCGLWREAFAEMLGLAHRLVQVEIEHVEMEAVARDIELFAHAKSGEIGCETRSPDVAGLATQIGDTNVVTFPIVPRPAISRSDVLTDGGDAA